MTFPTITDLPSAPQRTQTPDAFATTADTFVAALPDLVTEVNTAGAYIDTKTVSVGNAFQGTYSAGTTYTTGQSVLYSDLFYLSLVDSNTGNTPDTSPSQWVGIVGAVTTSSSGTYDFVASGAISNGDVVALNSDGTVSVASASFVEDFVEFTTNNAAEISATFDSVNNKVVVAYRDLGNSSYGTAVVGTISGTTITFGTPVVFHSSNAIQPSITYDSNAQKVVIAFRDNTVPEGAAIVGTVSGTSISFGTKVTFNNTDANYISTTYDANAQKVVIAYQETATAYPTAIVGTVSGTSISFGSETVIQSVSANDTDLTFDSSNNKVVAVYRNNSSGNPTAAVGTVSGTSISFGTPVAIASVNGYRPEAAFDSTNNKVAVVYTDGSNSSYGTIAAGAVSGTSISFGTPVPFNSGSTSDAVVVFNPDSGKLAILYDITNLFLVEATISGTTVSVSPNVLTISEFTNLNSLAITYDTNSDAAVALYRNASSGDDGTANVVKLGNGFDFVGVATTDISDAATGTITILGGVNESQTGLSIGADYYLDGAGSGGITTSSSTNTKVGRALAADKLLITEG